MSTRPPAGVIACRREVEDHPAHRVTDKLLARIPSDLGLTGRGLCRGLLAACEARHADLVQSPGVLDHAHV